MSTQTKGISLHIGLNRVDPAHYKGWDGALQGCENDANDLRAIAEAAGFETSMLLNDAGTAEAVTGAIVAAAERLEPGDFFLLTYSGHGSQLPDASANEADAATDPAGVQPDETDQRDETWVLFDRQLLDDELYRCWRHFRPGVRVLVLSDSCHSGSAIREVPGAPVANAARTMPKAQALVVYEANRGLYDTVRRAVPAATDAGAEPAAQVLLISGCQDEQTSADGARNGLFTQTLLAVWDGGAYKGGYKKFYEEIVARMPPWQKPNWMTVGATSAGFTRRKPFTI